MKNCSACELFKIMQARHKAQLKTIKNQEQVIELLIKNQQLKLDFNAN